MERLVSLGETLTRPSSIAGVAQAIGRGALVLCEGQRAAVYLRSISGIVTCRWSQGLSHEYVNRMVTPEGTNPWVHLSRSPDLMCMDLPKGRRAPAPEPVLLQDMRELPPGNEVRRIAESEGYRALGSWPLSRGGKVIGSVSCYFDAPHAWSRSEREVMVAFSLQAAAALEGAVLFEARTQQSALAEAAGTRIAEARRVLEAESADLFETERGLEAERARLLTLQNDLKAEQERLTEIRITQEAEHVRLTEVRREQEAEHVRLSEARRGLEVEQARLTEAQGKLEAEHVRLAETRSELAAEHVRLAAAQSTQQTELAHLAALQTEFEAAQGRLAVARREGATEADEEQARLSTARRELEEESARLAGARKALDTEHGRLAGAQQTLEVEHARLADARQKLDSEQARLAAARRELEGEQARLAEMRRELEGDHARHAEARKDLEAEYARLSEARRDVEAEHARLTEAREELEAEHARLSEARTESRGGQARPADAPLDPEPESTRLLEIYELGGPLPSAQTPEQIYAHLVERAATLLRLDRQALNPDQEVLTLARALDARDAHRPGYSELLARWVEAAAGMLACEQNRITDIRRAALLHDLGKIGVPEALLRKPGPLTEEDVAALRQAPVVAEMVLRPVRGMQGVACILRCRYEWWDGEGYPDGLKGDAIPLGARILAVADAYGEMITGRPDRPMLYYLDAIAVLRRGAGTRFDPQVVEVFCEMLKRERQETA